jgi:TRAP-type C4-dicarboxylate transport system permease small subunit
MNRWPTLLARFARRGEQIVARVSKLFHYAGGMILGLLILFITADVIGRYVFNSPITGDFELVILAAGLIASFSLAYTLVLDGHIRVDIVSSHFPSGLRKALDIVAYVFGLIFWTVATWRSFVYAMTLRKSNLVSGMLPIPIYPFVFIVALGCAMLCLVFFFRLVNFFFRE